jgi:hypothetical protein
MMNSPCMCGSSPLWRSLGGPGWACWPWTECEVCSAPAPWCTPGRVKERHDELQSVYCKAWLAGWLTDIHILREGDKKNAVDHFYNIKLFPTRTASSARLNQKNMSDSTWWSCNRWWYYQYYKLFLVYWLLSYSNYNQVGWNKTEMVTKSKWWPIKLFLPRT